MSEYVNRAMELAKVYAEATAQKRLNDSSGLKWIDFPPDREYAAWKALRDHLLSHPASDALRAAAEALESAEGYIVVAIEEGERMYTGYPDLMARKTMNDRQELEQCRAALSLCRAELDPTIAGEGENG